AGERCIRPVGEADHLAALDVACRRLGRLEYLQAALIEEESVISEQIGQLSRHRMAVREHLRLHLVQRLLDLRFVQSHGPVLSKFDRRLPQLSLRTNAAAMRSRKARDIGPGNIWRELAVP